MEWSGVEWSGVEWSGVEWSGVEWSGVGAPQVSVLNHRVFVTRLIGIIPEYLCDMNVNVNNKGSLRVAISEGMSAFSFSIKW